MEDTDEGLGLNEWRTLVINSNEFISSVNLENYGSKSNVDVRYSEEGSLRCSDLDKGVEGSAALGDNGWKSSNDFDNCGLVKSGVSIAERRAIKCGFNASKLSNSHFRLCRSFASSSDCNVTISPSNSPNTLLESPILLPNSQLSPTTGSFVSHPHNGNTHMVVSASSLDAEKGNDGSCVVMVKPPTETILSYDDNQVSFNGGLAQNMVANEERQSLTSVYSKMNVEYPTQCKEIGIDIHDAGTSPERNILNVASPNSSYVACPKMSPKNVPTMGDDDSGTHDSLDGDFNRVYPRIGPVRTGEDGYSWRKYGQKQVKGSEYPRSYYKCTHPSCQVKKKVERSPDGEITEIIYKGAHDHPKPQPCRKSTSGSLLPFKEASEIADGSDSCMKVNSDLGWRSMQSGFDGLDRTASMSAVTELTDPLSTTQGKPMSVLESTGTLEFSSTPCSHEDDEEDVASHGSFLTEHDNENEPDMKRRKKDGYFPETILGSRAIREPKVVIEIETEVDILDDGYRWRKYGQKVVKGNPNPRSYYKCTAPGCTVRKHVERSAESKKFVIVTYEGKHNHPVPAARNSSHASSGSGSLPGGATNTQTALATPRNYHLPKPEPCTHDFPLYFDPKLECNNDYLGPNFLGNLGAGSPWFYPLKLPALPNNHPYASYGLNDHHPVYASRIMPPIPHLSFPLPPRFPPSMSSYCNTEMSCSPAQSLYAGQQPKESNDRFLTPKQEQRDDSFFETESYSIDRADASSSVYNPSMGSY